MGEVRVPADKLWGAQTQRSLEHFSIGADLMPRQMIPAYAILKRACARPTTPPADSTGSVTAYREVSDEILAGQHAEMFPLHVWMTGSGTQFNMNVNEVIANRCSPARRQPLAANRPSIPTTMSTSPSPPTTPFPPP